MKNLILTLTSLFLVLGSTQAQKASVEEINTDQAIDVIAFGSCNHENDSQDYWPKIANNNPDIWLWMGDNIYGDSDDMKVLEAKYNRLLTNNYYKDFIQQIPVVGTWDDHDYGTNDGNKNYKYKKESKKLMFDFLGVPSSNPAWKREGAYQSYTLGPADQSVKIILLDTRSFQDPLERNLLGKSRYKANEQGTLLGEAQWSWLKEELENSSAQLNIIVTSIQLLANDHGYEKWGNFPNEKQRLFDMLQVYNIENVLLLSGDRHLAEISQKQLDGLSYPLIDVTSSGLTHSYALAKEGNSLRVSKLVPYKNFGLLELDWQEEYLEVNIKIIGIENLNEESYKVNYFYIDSKN